MLTDGNKFIATHKCLHTFLSEKFSTHMTSKRLYATVCMHMYVERENKQSVECVKKEKNKEDDKDYKHFTSCMHIYANNSTYL